MSKYIYNWYDEKNTTFDKAFRETVTLDEHTEAEFFNTWSLVKDKPMTETDKKTGKVSPVLTDVFVFTRKCYREKYNSEDEYEIWFMREPDDEDVAFINDNDPHGGMSGWMFKWFDKTQDWHFVAIDQEDGKADTSWQTDDKLNNITFYRNLLNHYKLKPLRYDFEKE